MIDSKQLVEKCHKAAYGYISEALRIDEQCDSLDKKLKALSLYKNGVNELQKGLNISIVDDPTNSKTQRLRQKMEVNLQMARDRIKDIELNVRNTKSTKISGGSKALTIPKNSDFVQAVRPKIIPYNNTNKNRPSTSQAVSRPMPADAVKKLKGVDSKLANLILDQILESRVSISFSDVAGLDDAKQAFSEAVILPTLKPELFTGLRSPVQGILLFGPPGNGKTMLARAVAGESKCTFFNISASVLTSKWVGEAEKLVKALFVLARDLQPVIIFIDEIDSILCERSDKENEVSRRLKTEFLLQFDGVASSSEDRILIIGATNRPQDLDDAVLRRFPRRIYVGLPNIDTRRELLQRLLAKNGNPLSIRDIEWASRRTENYSNFDLTQLAKEAAMGPLRDVNPKDLVNMDAHELRPIDVRDFEVAMQKIRPSCKMEHIKTLMKFNQDFGGS